MTDLASLNREVAEKVMGWELKGAAWVASCGMFNVFKKYDGWSPASDIAAAFEVVEKVCLENAKDFCCGFNGECWRAQFVQLDEKPCNAEGKELPEAICRAALQVIGPEPT